MTSLKAMPKQSGGSAARKLVGSLQDQLLAIAGPRPQVAKSLNTDFGVGLPPLYDNGNDTTARCKSKVVGSRVITWRYLARSHNAA
jgi:hypothetical protein